MSVIRVNPESVVAYGRDAQDRFDSIRLELKSLVSSVAEVRYFGPNAMMFKSSASQMAADFANRFSRDMGSLADSIRSKTSNIAAALGGQPISISVNGTPIEVPALSESNVVDIDVSALEALDRTVNQIFLRISDHLDGHLQKLELTDWLGNARDLTVDAVRTFTSSSKSACSEAQQGLARRVADQISAVRQADRG